MLYIPHTDFFNRIHLWAIVKHVKCTFHDGFYTHLQLERAISVLIFLSSHLSGLHMFLTDSGWCNMAWQMMSLSPLGGISLICSKNYFLQYVYFCISPKTFFQHQEFGGNCKPYNMYITLWLLYKFSCIHAYICLHFDIFTYSLSGNAWHRLWMQRYGMTDKSPHIWLKVTVTFSSGAHHPQDLTLYETNIYVRCVSTSTFLSIFYHIWMHNIIFIIHLSLSHTHVLSVIYIIIQHRMQSWSL